MEGAAGEEVRHREAARAPHAVVAANQADPGVDDAERRIRVEERRGPLEEGGRQVVVGVDGEDVGAARALDRDVARARGAAVVDPVHGDAGLARRLLEDGERAPVGRAVVDHHDLEVAVGLPRHALERLREVVAGVEDGNDDRDARLAHPLASVRTSRPRRGACRSTPSR